MPWIMTERKPDSTKEQVEEIQENLQSQFHNQFTCRLLLPSAPHSAGARPNSARSGASEPMISA